jgi:hypothetical protein
LSPLFRDPVFDGASDPVLIRNRLRALLVDALHQPASDRADEGGRVGPRERRRSGVLSTTVARPGAIGASSTSDHEFGRNTFWAPEVTWANDLYHVFVSYIRGVPDQWAGHARHIHHYVSEDLLKWDHRGPLSPKQRPRHRRGRAPPPGRWVPHVVQGRGRRRQHVVSRQS